jgi:hypothetical protein
MNLELWERALQPKINPMYAALFSLGIQARRIIKPPFIMPAPPIPATARPRISIFEDTAAPHNREPSPNSTKNVMKVY